MSHRAKHLKRNWSPDRYAKAEQRHQIEQQVQADAAMARTLKLMDEMKPKEQ